MTQTVASEALPLQAGTSFSDLFQLGNDPYPIYHRMRAEDPVHWSPDVIQAWFIFRHADVLTIKEDDIRFSSSKVIPEFLKADQRNTLWWVESKGILFLDGVDHTRARRLVYKTFTPEWQESMRPRINELANALLDQVQDVGSMDVIADYAVPLTITQICDVLGTTCHDLKILKQWSIDIFRGLDPITKPDLVERGHASARQLIDYLRAGIRERAKNPQNDLISAMLTVEENGVKLTEDEILGNLFQMYIGGHDEATNLIGNGVLALLRHPDQLDLLKQNPLLIEDAVEEFLRYDAPLLGIMRAATEDMHIGGKTIQEGQRVFLLYGAANRDPERFPDPDRLDITRRYSLHFSLGWGRHFCIGAKLGRLQAQVAINTLIQRLPNLRLNTDELEWRKSFTIRALNALPVAFTPGK
ncbi:cytochrome P450 [Scytonema sp. NUACC21]